MRFFPKVDKKDLPKYLCLAFGVKLLLKVAAIFAFLWISGAVPKTVPTVKEDVATIPKDDHSSLAACDNAWKNLGDELW